MNANDLASLIPLALLLVFAYMLLIRPARRRAHEIHSVQSALSTGDEVMLTSGIFGVVTSVGEERLNVELAPGVEIAVARAAVAKIIRDVPADPAAPEIEDAAGDADDGPVTEPRSSQADRGPGDDGESRGAY